jgi:GT2 family glycosyltransferase
VPGVQVFQPPTANGPPFPYADRSVEFVVAPAGGDSERESRRIATHVVLLPTLEAQTGSWRLDVDMVGSRLGVHAPSVSIVVPTHDGVELVSRCLASLDETVPPELRAEVVVVDDASEPQARDALEALVHSRPRVRIVRTDTNLGFVGAVNLGAEAATGDVLVLLNDDTVTLPGWLTALVRTFRQRPDAGAVGGKLVYPDGRLQEAGGIVFSDGSAANFGRGASNPDAPEFSYLREVDYVSGALLATPADVFRSFGGLDHAYGFGYYDDSDYAFKLRKSGLRVYFQPESAVVHLEGATAGTDLSSGPKRNQELNRSVFIDRWASELTGQPQRPASPSAGVLAGIADRAAR